jgi:hypothetical protein
MASGTSTSITIQMGAPNVVTITHPPSGSAALTVAGMQGPSGMSVVSHGTNASAARPAGVPVVYWIGTVKPTNALPYDLWYNG